jgi:hypothetical protein
MSTKATQDRYVVMETYVTIMAMIKFLMGKDT